MITIEREETVGGTSRTRLMVEPCDRFDPQQIQFPPRLLSLPCCFPEQQEAILALFRSGVVPVHKERLHCHVVRGKIVAVAIQRKEAVGE